MTYSQLTMMMLKEEKTSYDDVLIGCFSHALAQDNEPEALDKLEEIFEHQLAKAREYVGTEEFKAKKKEILG